MIKYNQRNINSDESFIDELSTSYEELEKNLEPISVDLTVGLKSDANLHMTPKEKIED